MWNATQEKFYVQFIATLLGVYVSIGLGVLAQVALDQLKKEPEIDFTGGLYLGSGLFFTGIFAALFFIWWFRNRDENKRSPPTVKKWSKEDWSKATAIASIVSAVAAILLALYTAGLVESQNRLIEREKMLEGPYLSIWQSNRSPILEDRGRFVNSQQGWGNAPHLNIYLRNDGKTSSGPINIQAEYPTKFRLEGAYIENLPAHEGRCVQMGSFYCSTLSDENCTRENVPTGGAVSIPLVIDCTFCKQKDYLNYTLCIFNESVNECF